MIVLKELNIDRIPIFEQPTTLVSTDSQGKRHYGTNIRHQTIEELLLYPIEQILSIASAVNDDPAAIPDLIEQAQDFFVPGAATSAILGYLTKVKGIRDSVPLNIVAYKNHAIVQISDDGRSDTICFLMQQNEKGKFRTVNVLDNVDLLVTMLTIADNT
ncbi:MAG: hypothetical protein JSS75_06050 [Bacteroidetes bacterium]|nr:hypothetical protein [Bacteroidota bacterium]